jgi:hypothetical protein
VAPTDSNLLNLSIMAISVDSYFRSRINQYASGALQKLTRYNPFRSLVPMRPWDFSLGLEPTIETYTHELPESYVQGLTNVTISNAGSGSGGELDESNSCDVAATTIKRGWLERAWRLRETAFKTDVFCLSDIKRGDQAAAQAAAFERALKEYLTVWWADYYRVSLIEMCGNKVTTIADDTISLSENDTNPDFTGITSGDLPAADLDWEMLHELYINTIQNGAAEEMAIGRTNAGQPVFPLVISPALKRRLFKDTSIAEEVKYFDPKHNLKAMGIDMAINGFMPVVDLYPMRFGTSYVDTNIVPIADTDELTLDNTIYPTRNTSATSGRTYERNPQYKADATGGNDTVDSPNAQYEVAYILPSSIFETQFEPVNPTTFSGMNFNPETDYVGNFQFINNKTFQGDNDRGNLGYYLADVRVANKPLFPEFGTAILTLAHDN